MGTQIAVQNVLIAVTWIGINIGCLFVYTQEYHKAFGSLVAANAFVASLPAQRNR
jgi:hypothetical protein